jgi:hypothetical protein
VPVYWSWIGHPLCGHFCLGVWFQTQRNNFRKLPTSWIFPLISNTTNLNLVTRTITFGSFRVSFDKLSNNAAGLVLDGWSLLRILFGKLRKSLEVRGSKQVKEYSKRTLPQSHTCLLCSRTFGRVFSSKLV